MSTAAITDIDALAGIRNTMAAYLQAVDDGRSDDIAETFCWDGVLILPRQAPLVGRAAIRAKFAAQVADGRVRHLVVNARITDVESGKARAVSDLTVVALTEAGWIVRQNGRYIDTLRKDHTTWQFATRTLEID